MMDIPEQRLTLVLMAGYGGSGKTTLAHALARYLHWPVLDKDVLKNYLFRASEYISDELASRIAYEQLFALALDVLLRQHISVILDTSAVFPPVTIHAQYLRQQANAHLKIILCKAGEATRQQRIAQRNEQDAGQRQLLIDPARAREEQVDHFAHLPVECLIEIDTTQSFEAYFQRVLHYLCEECPSLAAQEQRFSSNSPL